MLAEIIGTGGVFISGSSGRELCLVSQRCPNKVNPSSLFRFYVPVMSVLLPLPKPPAVAECQMPHDKTHDGLCEFFFWFLWQEVMGEE